MCLDQSRTFMKQMCIKCLALLAAASLWSARDNARCMREEKCVYWDKVRSSHEFLQLHSLIK